MSIDSLCNTTVDVLKVTTASDAYGTWTETESARYTAMPCRMQPLSGQEIVMYSSQRVGVTHKLYAPPEYGEIAEDDVVSDAAGTRYGVVFVRDPDRMGHHMEVVVREVRPNV